MEVVPDASEVPNGSGRVSTAPGMGTLGSLSGAGNGNSRGTTGISPFANCELRASLAGYVSQNLNLTGRTSLDNPDVGTISLHRMGSPQSATTVTATTLKAPKEARKALEKGPGTRKEE